MMDLGRRTFILAGAGSFFASRSSILPVSASNTDAAPAAISGSGWSRKSEWNFGTEPANNIRRFTDWLRSGWYMDATVTFLNDQCNTFNIRDLTDNNPNFAAFPDHCDIVAIWNGGRIASAQGNGSLTSLSLNYDVPFANAIGYYELTCKVPSVSGAWPAWWTVGHRPGQRGEIWGPEIDIFEFYDNKTTECISTLHGSRKPSYCFMRAGGNPPGVAAVTQAVYDGSKSWDMGHITYTPGGDLAQGYHRFGARVDPSYRITIWVDDKLVGTFAANQYCDDDGHPVAVQLKVNLALGTHNPDPVGSIHTADFGGANNRTATNKFRMSLKNIQIWGP